MQEMRKVTLAIILLGVFQSACSLRMVRHDGCVFGGPDERGASIEVGVDHGKLDFAVIEVGGNDDPQSSRCEFSGSNGKVYSCEVYYADGIREDVMGTKKLYYIFKKKIYAVPLVKDANTDGVVFGKFDWQALNGFLAKIIDRKVAEQLDLALKAYLKGQDYQIGIEGRPSGPRPPP
jgi:hypothetical protein